MAHSVTGILPVHARQSLSCVTTVRLKLEQEQLARVVDWFDLGAIGLEGR
jgi:hypothetical protein